MIEESQSWIDSVNNRLRNRLFSSNLEKLNGIILGIIDLLGNALAMLSYSKHLGIGM